MKSLIRGTLHIYLKGSKDLYKDFKGLYKDFKGLYKEGLHKDFKGFYKCCTPFALCAPPQIA